MPFQLTKTHSKLSGFSDPISSLVVVSVLCILIGFSSVTQAAEMLSLSGSVSISTEKFLHSFQQLGAVPLVQSDVIPTYRVNAEVPVDLNNIEYAVTLSGTNARLNGPELVAQIAQTNALIRVSNLNINTLIERQIGGAIFRLQLNAQCTDLRVLVEIKNSQVRVTANELLSQQSAMTPNLQVLLGETTLHIGELHCMGVNGIETLISDEIHKTFQNKSLLQEIVAQKLSQQVAFMVQKQKQQIADVVDGLFKKIDTNATVKVLATHVGEKAILLKFDVNTTRAASLTDVKQAKSTPLQTQTEKNYATLVLNKVELESFLVNASLKSEQQSYISSKEIPALNKLINSRFMQFFLWPGLMKRGKGKELILAPRLEALTIDIPVGQPQTTLTLEATVGTWILDELKPMVYFRTHGKIAGHTQDDSSDVLLAIGELSTNYTWNTAYVNEKKCSTRISTSILDQVGPTVFSQSYGKLSINQMTVPVAGALRVKSFERNDLDQLILNIEQVPPVATK